MDSNIWQWGLLILGMVFGGALVFVTIVPKAYTMGTREATARLRSGGAAGHPPTRLIGGPAEGIEVHVPEELCSRVGLRIAITVEEEDGRMQSHTYVIVGPHEAMYEPEGEQQ